ncbi:hypothetical protein OS493_035005 [Desmophyllum pertusum]|uniref:Uncharacterized protein n=1 Tax=Desmophyllum pertusum TaxID=174260 RepID=A0A9W9Y812_9CNID|nr:hypothetical protein OS493_035005 [Desmophyllum pertusum]
MCGFGGIWKSSPFRPENLDDTEQDINVDQNIVNMDQRPAVPRKDPPMGAVLQGQGGYHHKGVGGESQGVGGKELRNGKHRGEMP